MWLNRDTAFHRAAIVQLLKSFTFLRLRQYLHSTQNDAPKNGAIHPRAGEKERALDTTANSCSKACEPEKKIRVKTQDELCKCTCSSSSNSRFTFLICHINKTHGPKNSLLVLCATKHPLGKARQSRPYQRKTSLAVMQHMPDMLQAVWTSLFTISVFVGASVGSSLTTS